MNLKGEIIMIKKLKIGFETDEKVRLEHLFLKHQDNSDTLVVIYPGGNYSCERPLLHYIRKAALLRSYDVLCMNYGDAFIGLKFGEELFDRLTSETKKAFDFCINDRKYKKIYFIGKSIGTVICGRIRSLECEVEYIFLTPIKETINYINKHNGLIITGTKDKLFTNDYIKQISNDVNNQVMILEGANHSLELDADVLDTIRLHEKIVNRCDNFIKR